MENHQRLPTQKVEAWGLPKASLPKSLEHGESPKAARVKSGGMEDSQSVPNVKVKAWRITKASPSKRLAHREFRKFVVSDNVLLSQWLYEILK